MKNIYLSKCWLCGSTKKLTGHHVVGKKEGKSSLGVIPLCEECHNLIENLKLAIQIIKKQKKVMGVKRLRQIVEDIERVR